MSSTVVHTLLLTGLWRLVVVQDSKAVDISKEIVLLTGLQCLDLTNNDLTGYVSLLEIQDSKSVDIPTEIVLLTGLQRLNLTINDLTG
jgi:Leucine-rich repeat (LRR) protein